MRFLACSLVMLVTFTSNTQAECFGDAAQAFGCGVQRREESSLQSFGDSRNEVIPDYGTPRQISVDDLFTADEQAMMYRNIILNRGVSGASNGALQRSVQGGSQPNRYLRGMPRVRPQF
jgi:hypothetical protein